MAGHGFRGRGLNWNPDRQAVEQERQRWVMERVGTANELIVELTVDPDQAYREHRDAYLETGDLRQLAMALEYVR
jgi:hypothetical protein